jgi:hypothetical protein
MVTVTWYKLNADGKTASCLSQEELNELVHYVANNKVNFDKQNYFRCDSTSLSNWILKAEELPKMGIVEKLILRKDPKIRRGKNLNCPDVELLDEYYKVKHNYNLNFDLIGEIHYFN